MHTSLLSFAFVEFETAEEAKEALETLNNSEIEGRTIRLEFSQNSGGRDGGRGNTGRLSDWTCGHTLHFLAHMWFLSTHVWNVRRKSEYNAMSSVPVCVIVCRFYPQSLWHSCLCFLLMLSNDVLQNVDLNDLLPYPGPTKTLFVKGLSEDTNDHTLKDSFDGAVAARIVTDRDTGSSKG